MKYNKKFYEKYGIKVTEEAVQKIADKKLDGLIQRMHERVHDDDFSDDMIAELETAIQIYPDSTTLKSYLHTAYKQTNQKLKAFDFLHSILKQHPDYVFGILNMGEYYLLEGYPDKAASLLIEPYDVVKFDKREFTHISIFRGYYSLALQIEIARKNLEKAEALHRILFDYNKNDELVKILARRIVALRMQANPMFKKATNERLVETISKPI